MANNVDSDIPRQTAHSLAERRKLRRKKKRNGICVTLDNARNTRQRAARGRQREGDVDRDRQMALGTRVNEQQEGDVDRDRQMALCSMYTR